MRDSCDVLVIGCGPAGIAAAARAAEAGASVIAVDEGFGPGGQIWRPSPRSPAPQLAREWIARLGSSGAVVRNATSVVDANRDDDHFVVTTESRGAATRMTARVVILATGARERFLPFPGWTLPNVVGVGGAQALLKNGTSFSGKRIVIAGSGPLLLPVAASVSKAGGKILLVAEQAPAAKLAAFVGGLWRSPTTLVQAAVLRAGFLRTPYATGTWVAEARGEAALREVVIANSQSRRTIECDVLCAAFGLVPNTEIARLLGCATSRGAVVVDDTQATNVPGVYCCGEPTGIGGVERALVEGEIAALAATARDVPARLRSRRSRLHRAAANLERAFGLRGELLRLAHADTIVCRCEDVRYGDIDPRGSIRQAKLSTRLGMGPCQGRICGAALESLLRWPPDSVRVPMQPAKLNTLLGDSAAVS